MRTGRYVAYHRVSTDKQGRSGLGLEAQQKTIRDRLNGGPWQLVAEFTEVESGRVSERPELAKALAHCRVMKAKLIVANVSRLTRNPDFMRLLADAGVEVEFCDLPESEGAVGVFMLRQMLAVAELEAGMVSERTKKALAAAKARGVKLGGNRGGLTGASAKGGAASAKVRQESAARRAQDLAGIIATIRAEGGVTLSAIAEGLNGRGIPTARGGTWAPTQVARVLSVLDNDNASVRAS